MDLKTLQNEKETEKPEVGLTPATEEVVKNDKVKVVNATDILPAREHIPENQEFIDGLMNDLDKAAEFKINEIEEIHRDNYQKAQELELAKNDEYVSELEEDDGYDLNDMTGTPEQKPIQVNKDNVVEEAPVKKEVVEPTPSKQPTTEPQTFSNKELLEPDVNTAELVPDVNDIPTSNVFNIDLDDEDLYDDDDDEEIKEADNIDSTPSTDTSTNQEDDYAVLKNEIKRTLVDSSSGLDLAEFTIQTKAISASKVLNFSKNQAKLKSSDWGLFNSRKPITLTALSGSEVEKFNPNQDSRNALQAYKEMYGIIYNHLLDENKPKSLEEWVKTIYFHDNEHLMFAVYKACFEGKNIVPYSCSNPNCSKSLFMENVKIEDMVKYSSDEAKERARQIIAKCEVNPNAEYESKLVAINTNYAISFRPPTVYAVMFESLSLDRQTREKYADVLSVLSYIDNIFWIDTINKRLIPVSTKPDPLDLTKTVKRKIKVYSDIINTFTSDEYNKIIVTMTNINNAADDISYVIPETHCPECGALIAETAVDPLSMVFERHQYVVVRDL